MRTDAYCSRLCQRFSPMTKMHFIIFIRTEPNQSEATTLLYDCALWFDFVGDVVLSPSPALTVCMCFRLVLCFVLSSLVNFSAMLADFVSLM